MQNSKRYWLWGGVVFVIINLVLGYVTTRLFSFPIYFLPLFPVMDFIPWGMLGYDIPRAQHFLIYAAGMFLNGALWGWLLGLFWERYWNVQYSYNKRSAFFIGFPLAIFALMNTGSPVWLVSSLIFFLVSWFIMMRLRAKSDKAQLITGIVLVSFSLTASRLLHMVSYFT